MGILVCAGIIALSAVLGLLRPALINVLSEADRIKINPKKTGRVAFWGLMATALTMIILYIVGIRNELVPIFIGIPGAIITAALIQGSIPKE